MSCSVVSWSEATSEPPKVVRTLVFCTFWRHNGVHFFDISTSKSGPMLVYFCAFWLGKCASRHNGVHFFHIRTSKSGANMWCFVHFDLEMCFAPQQRALFPHPNIQKWREHGVFVHFEFEMCFAPQRRALFRHPNRQKWREHVVFCTFWLGNVLRATTACTFSTSQLPKVFRTPSVF